MEFAFGSSTTRLQLKEVVLPHFYPRLSSTKNVERLAVKREQNSWKILRIKSERDGLGGKRGMRGGNPTSNSKSAGGATP